MLQYAIIYFFNYLSYYHFSSLPFYWMVQSNSGGASWNAHLQVVLTWVLPLHRYTPEQSLSRLVVVRFNCIFYFYFVGFIGSLLFSTPEMTWHKKDATRERENQQRPSVWLISMDHGSYSRKKTMGNSRVEEGPAPV